MCDYHDTEALTFFMDALKRHAKAKGASQLEITPESPYRLRDTNGASLPDDQNGAPDNKLIEQLEAIGFTHGGFTVGYTAVPRWRYLKDLTGITDEKSLLKSYDKRTQWSVKRAQSMGVHVRELSDDESSSKPLNAVASNTVAKHISTVSRKRSAAKRILWLPRSTSTNT